jgi:uncharacterized membrane protein YbhN (UPF0104 family)
LKPDSKFVKFIRGLATTGVLMSGTYYLFTNLDSFNILATVNWKILVFMVFFIFINIFASSSENAVLFQALGAPIGNIESFGLTNVSAFLNLILPQGGTITKAIYLKQKYGIPYSKTPALFLGLLVIYLLIGSLVILITNLATIYMGGAVPFIFWIAACLGCTSGIFFMIDFPKELLLRQGKIGSMISNYSDGWKSLRTNRSCLIKACIWQFVIFASAGVWVSAAYYSLGLKINPLLGIGLSVLLSFINILTIIPGNLGIQETAYGYFTYLTGMSFAQGVVVSAFVRVVLLLITLFLAPASWYNLFYKQNITVSRQAFTKTN